MDPVRATLIKYEGKNPLDNLISMNYTCNEICAAFGHDSQFSDCKQSCAKMARKITNQKYSVDYRDLQSPMIWDRDLKLHYLPNLLDKGLSPADAKSECKIMCKQSSDPATCLGNCELDYNAISDEGYEKPKNKKGEEESEEDFMLCGCSPYCPCKQGNCKCIFSRRNDLSQEDEEELYEECGCSPDCPCRRNQCNCRQMGSRRKSRGVSWLWLLLIISVFILGAMALCQKKM